MTPTVIKTKGVPMIKRTILVLLAMLLTVVLAAGFAAQGGQRGGGGAGGGGTAGAGGGAGAGAQRGGGGGAGGGGGRGGAAAPAVQLPSPAVTADRLLKATAEPQNWLMYSGSYSSQRHSPLTQITTTNVKDLTLKWVFQSRSLEKSEVTPLVVNGIMYTVQSINTVLALNATTGKTLWTYTHTPDAAARNCCGNLTRGLAISGDTLFLAAYDVKMIAIDAKTGRELWKTVAGDPKEGQSFTTAPLVIKDKVIAGTAGGEFGVRGWIAAWDVNTGKEVWRFYTTPGPGEFGNETWSGDSWKSGGGPSWVTGSYGPETNLPLWWTGNSGAGWEGQDRRRSKPLRFLLR